MNRYYCNVRAMFRVLTEKFPKISISDSNDVSRWEFMDSLEKAYWHMVDNILFRTVDRVVFFNDFIRYLNNRIVKYSWVDEWESWKSTCVVSGIALVTNDNGEWKVLMVKNKNSNYPHLSTTWPGGKPDITDNTLWEQATREFFEETGLDLRNDQDKVRHILTNKRAVSFVIVVDKDDPRLNNIVIDEKEIHSYIWLPFDFDDITIMKGKKTTKHIDDGKIYMGMYPESGFRKLSGIAHKLTETSDEVQDYILACPWTMKSGTDFIRASNKKTYYNGIGFLKASSPNQ